MTRWASAERPIIVKPRLRPRVMTPSTQVVTMTTLSPAANPARPRRKIPVANRERIATSARRRTGIPRTRRSSGSRRPAVAITPISFASRWVAPRKIPSAASSGATTAVTVSIPRSTLSLQVSGAPAAEGAAETVGSQLVEVVSSAAITPSSNTRAKGDQGRRFGATTTSGRDPSRIRSSRGRAPAGKWAPDRATRPG